MTGWHKSVLHISHNNCRERFRRLMIKALLLARGVGHWRNSVGYFFMKTATLRAHWGMQTSAKFAYWLTPMHLRNSCFFTFLSALGVYLKAWYVTSHPGNRRMAVLRSGDQWWCIHDSCPTAIFAVWDNH